MHLAQTIVLFSVAVARSTLTKLSSYNEPAQQIVQQARIIALIADGLLVQNTPQEP